MRKFVSVLVSAGVLSLVLAAPAAAHVTATPDEGAMGSFFRTAFRVGHGCEGSPTKKVIIKVPVEDSVTSVHVEPVPGWNVKVAQGELPEPVDVHGEQVTEGVKTVTWTAQTPMPDAYFQEFGMTMLLPEEDTDGVLWFPTVQQCVEGANRWVTIPESVDTWGEEESPAPYVKLAPAEGGHDEGGGEEPAADGGAMTEDDVRAIAASEVSAVEPASDDGSDPLLWGALALGALGFFLGLGAFMRSGRSTS